MMPLPDIAKPVVEVLRRDVPRPAELPVFVRRGVGLRFRRKGTDALCCPMGLHPKAVRADPFYYGDFPECWGDAIGCFGQWWDNVSLDDAQAAIDAIWPPESTTLRAC